MRIELVVSDSTLEGQILANVSDPQEYVLELVRGDRGTQAVKRLNGTPDYLAILGQAEQVSKTFQSREEIDGYLKDLRTEW